MAPKLNTVMLSELAAGNCRNGIRRGMMALRVGWFTAKKPCCTASNTNTIHTLFSPRCACSHSMNDVAPIPTVVIISRVRRSITSANAPPHSPNTTSGTNAKAPASPTYAELDVIWKICCGTATTESWAPMTVTTPDAHRRR